MDVTGDNYSLSPGGILVPTPKAREAVRGAVPPSFLRELSLIDKALEVQYHAIWEKFFVMRVQGNVEDVIACVDAEHLNASLIQEIRKAYRERGMSMKEKQERRAEQRAKEIEAQKAPHIEAISAQAEVESDVLSDKPLALGKPGAPTKPPSRFPNRVDAIRGKE